MIAIFSQYGEILDINLPRIPEGGLRDQGNGNPGSSQDDRQRQQQQQQQQQGGKPGDRRGFGFILYDDQRSTVLAVDNLNGFNLLGRTIRVDHVRDYKMPGAKKKEEEGELVEPSRNAAPALEKGSGEEEDEEDDDQVDLADPMASYIAASKKEKSRSKEDKDERRKRKEERKRKREEKEVEREKRKKSSQSGERDNTPKRRRSEEEYDDKRGSRERYSQSRYQREESYRSRHHEERSDGYRERVYPYERERSRPKDHDDSRRHGSYTDRRGY